MCQNDVKALSNELQAVFMAKKAHYTNVTLRAVSRDSGVSYATVKRLRRGEGVNDLPTETVMRLWGTLDKVHPTLGGYKCSL